MKEQVLDFLNNELISYIIEILAVFFSVCGGTYVIFKKVKELFEKATTVFKSATDNTEKTNTELKAVIEENKKLRKEAKEREDVLMARLEAQEQTLKDYIKSQDTLLKLPEAFAEMVCCTPDQVRNGVARKVCDKLGMNDTAFDKAEKQKKVETNKVNGGE